VVGAATVSAAAMPAALRVSGTAAAIASSPRRRDLVLAFINGLL
jgi:hypothetical protein